MKRILLSLIAFAGVWMTAGAVEAGYKSHTEDASFTVETTALNSINGKNFVYTTPYDVNGTTVSTIFTLSSNNDKNIEYLNEGCLNLNRGTNYKFTWNDTNSDLYSIKQVSSFTIKTAAYQGLGIPFISPKSDVYVSLNGENKVKISSGNTDKKDYDKYVKVTSNQTKTNGSTGVSIVYSGLNAYDQYICYISCNYQIEYYTLDFADANTVYGQAKALYEGLEGASVNSGEANSLKTAIDDMTSFKDSYENKAVATNNGLHTQLAGKVTALQTAIDAFTCELDQAQAFNAPGRTITNINVIRNIKAGVWNTLCLPFSMPVPDGWTVKELTGLEYKDGTYDAKFTDINGDMEAGKPYIVVVSEAVSEIPYENKQGFALCNGPLSVTKQTTDNAHSITITGVFAPQDLANCYFISGGSFWFAPEGKNNTTKAYRAIFVTDEQQGGALGYSFTEDEETGISFVDGNDNGNVNDNYYNIAGQRVNADAKGIIIKNGKKYFQK